MKHRLEIHAERSICRDSIDVYAIHRGDDGVVYVADPLVMRAREHDGRSVGSPTIELSPREAQHLIDELWRCGMRPTEGTGSAGSLAATERHLNDMRAIAKGMLKKDGVEIFE